MRRFTAGVDVTAAGVTLVVLSRRARAAAPVRIEWLAHAPLPRDAMLGAEIVDRAALVAALRDVFGRLPRRCDAATLRCAMALPVGATVVASVPLARFPVEHCIDGDSQTLAALEPAVLAEAERITGVERHELAVDWCLDAASEGPDERRARQSCRVTITSAPRQHLEARIECAAMAGIALCAIDGDAHAALRAMRHAAALELPPEDAYVALWVGPEGVHGWHLADDEIVREMRYPALEHADLVDALRCLHGGEPPGCGLVAGNVGMLDDTHLSLADLAHVLGCPVLPFECATFALAGESLDAALLREPACAVAFGLALRGVSE
ncbi:MAG TPA: pilus assembly protein PilM [Paraburkholderia sp.]|jgi:Tfp pilus assembly PilM family ATPase|nr:pilus assembly protein PilM [Paraburkholderia sp.]